GAEGKWGAPVPAGGEDRHVGAEAMDRTVVEVYGDDSAAAALFVHDQVDGEEFDEEFSGVAQRLAVHRVQHRMAGAVGGGTSALRSTLAVMGGHAPEGALIDLAVLPPRERQTPMFQFVDRLRRAPA